MRNEDTREELTMKPIDEDIREYQKKWKQHLGRMDNSRVSEVIINYKHVGLRDLGRSRSLWQDQF
jgi:hypothetical protein